MSGRIRADLGRLTQLAGSLDGLAQQVDALRTNLASAVAPALRGDVPEYWTISAQSAGASGALGDLAASIRGRADMVRRWTTDLARAEAMLAIYRYQLHLQGMAFLNRNPLVPPGISKAQALEGKAADDLRADLLDVAIGLGLDQAKGLPRLADGSLDLLNGVGFLAAKGIVAKSSWNLWGLVTSAGDTFGADSTKGERVVGALNFGAGVSGTGAVALEILGFGGGAAHGALLTGAKFLGPAAATATVVYGYSNYLQKGFAADDAAGVDSMERLNQQTIARQQLANRIPVVGPVDARTVVAVDALLRYGNLAIHRYQTRNDPPPPELIDPTKQAQLLAAARALHPDARIIPQDGRFVIELPSAAGVSRFTVDNTTLVVR